MINTQDFIFWMVDVQQKLFFSINDSNKLLEKLLFVIKCLNKLQFQVLVSEQYPQGMGPTLPELQREFPSNTSFFQKTAFSGCKEEQILQYIKEHPKKTWVIFGVESHICIWQTVKDLHAQGEKVVVLRDAIGSRYHEDHLSAIDEIKHLGVRVTTSETFFYECVENKNSSCFQSLLECVKGRVT